MSGRREASSVLVLVEPSWAWLPPASPQGATTKHSALPRLTLCRVRKGDNPLHCVVPPEQHPQGMAQRAGVTHGHTQDSPKE